MFNVTEKIAAIIGCEPEELTPNSRAGKHHLWDSLAHVKILIWLEADHGLKISDKAIKNLNTVEEIEGFINEHSK